MSSFLHSAAVFPPEVPQTFQGRMASYVRLSIRESLIVVAMALG